MYRKIFITVIISILLMQGCRSRTFDSDFNDAEAKMGLGDVMGALGVYEAIAKKYPDDPRRSEILLRIGKAYEDNVVDTKKAIRVYTELIARYPLSDTGMQAREFRANLSEKEGDFEAAIEDYEALIKHFYEFPSRHHYQILLGSVYLANHNYSQARIELSPIFDEEAVPKSILERALFIYAESYFLGERPNDAIRWYRALIQNFPDSEFVDEAKLHLANCLEDIGHLDASRIVTESAEGYPNKKVIDARLHSIDERGRRPSVKRTADKPTMAPAQR